MSRSSHLEKNVPSRVGPYRIESKLGSGGMGEVYRAWDTRLERGVAVKKFLGKDSKRDKNRQRLRREARAVASLNHPAIVHVYDLLETEDGDWIVMELVEGRTLRSLMKTRPVVETEAIALTREITDGLAAAHARGLVHRDLKAENVMVTLQGRVKILDFGLAVNLEKDADITLAPRGRVAGTSRAMSPEQAMGLTVDRRSDLFSLGTLLYEMVTRESPFQGESSYVTMTRVCRHRQRPANEVEASVSPELSRFIDHLLEKDPDRRPRSADEVEAVLASLAGTAALPPSLVYLVQPVEGTLTEAVTLTDTHELGPQTTEALGGLRSGLFEWTVLVTDLANSVELLRRYGDARASKILMRYDRFVRDLLARYGGREIDKSEAFYLLFRRPLDAVRFALGHQEQLAVVEAEFEVKLTVRTGIHLGEIFLHENPPEDVAHGAKPLEAEGRTKLIASRVMSLARPGQVLATRGVHELANLGMLEPSSPVEWKALGVETLPGMDKEVELFEVGPPGLASSAGEITEGEAETAPPRRWGLWGWALAVLAVVAVLIVALVEW